MLTSQYNTGLLVGRAYSYAHRLDPDAETSEAATELCQLADGDRMTIVFAQARFKEFLRGPQPTLADERALRLLQTALEEFDGARLAAVG